jgi:hypothetical protein
MSEPEPQRPRWRLWLIRAVIIVAGLYIALLIGLSLRASAV